MIPSMVRHCVVFLLSCCLLSLSVPVDAGKLKDILGGMDIEKKYPPPTPKPQERKRLADIYDSLLGKYPYPEALFAKKTENITLKEIETEAAPYVRKVEVPPSRIEIGRKRLVPFGPEIEKASALFDVPENVIMAVIIQESSGNPKAKAKAPGTAKGLMQTINATFAMARENLKKDYDIAISDPLVARDSIFAGTWYLSYVFELARQDFPEFSDRSRVEHWKKALEYYYAGPNWGKNPKPIFHVWSNGRKITIKKDYYSSNVLAYASRM